MSTIDQAPPGVDAVDSIPLGPAMTVEEFLALPDDGIHRELIAGHVWELGMTVRGRIHCGVEARVAQRLLNWLDRQPKPRGRIVSGEAGFYLRGAKESAVGIDVAYVSPELEAATTDPEQRLYDGPPVLAVEILSTSDRIGEIHAKLAVYREAGVVVWVADPDLRTVTVHQPGHSPVMFNETQELVGDPYLPGFREPVARFFEA